MTLPNKHSSIMKRLTSTKPERICHGCKEKLCDEERSQFCSLECLDKFNDHLDTMTENIEVENRELEYLKQELRQAINRYEFSDDPKELVIITYYTDRLSSI